MPARARAAPQVGRTAEMARTFGIDFFSVLTRGSQYRVESLLLRLAHASNYVAVSPSREQVGRACVRACANAHRLAGAAARPRPQPALLSAERPVCWQQPLHLLGCLGLLGAPASMRQGTLLEPSVRPGAQAA